MRGDIGRRAAILGGAAALTSRAAFGQATGAPSYGPQPGPVSRIGPQKFGSLGTRMPFNGSYGNPAAGTIMSVWTAEAPFFAVRPVFINMNTTTNPFNSVAIAPSSKLNDQWNPTDATGTANNSLWQLAYTNNAGAAGNFPIPSLSGTARSGTIPAATQNSLGGSPTVDRQWGLFYGDWVMAESLPRLDAGATLPLLFTRVYASGGAPSLGTPNPVTGWDTYASGRIIRCNYNSADVATTPGTVGAGLATFFLSPHAMQFMYETRGLSCLVFGDSLSQGFGTLSAQNDPYQMAAAALSTPAFPVTVCKAAWSGMSSLSFDENGLALMQSLLPDVVFIRGESPNDVSGGSGATTALFQASFTRALAIAEQATRQFCYPVLITASPWGYTGAQEAARQVYNGQVRASGYPYVDMDAILASSPGSNTVLPAYQSSAVPPHYNDAGSTALMTQGVIPVLTKIMAARLN